MLPEPAGGGEHKRGLAPGRRVVGLRQIVGGQALEHARGDAGVRDVVGDAERGTGGERDEFDVGTGGRAPGDAVAGVEAGDVGAEGEDGVRALAARDEGGAERSAAPAFVDVLEVDPGGGQADQEVAAAGARPLPVPEAPGGRAGGGARIRQSPCAARTARSGR
ncbi:hypothetical protein SRO_2023 [Streptomyces rochei]|nr:hypothetical protein SRO_2023 [Streptomyces rochei]